MRKKNIVFINMPIIPLSQLTKGTVNRIIRCFPFGILYLSAILKKQNYSGEIGCIDYLTVEPIEFTTKDFDKIIISKALKSVSFEPDILAFSFNFSSQYGFFSASLPILKELWPKAKIVVGGIHATNCVDYLLSHHDIDYIVAGEAEESFPILLSFLSKDEKDFYIKGIHSKGNIHYDLTGRPEISFPISNLDELPFPDWSIIDMDFYIREEKIGTQLFYDEIDMGSDKDRHASIITSRGCPFRCTFCASHTVHGRILRQRSIQNVIEEIRQLNKVYACNFFHLQDDLAFPTIERAYSLLKAIKETKIKDLKISSPQTLSINCTSKEMIDIIIEYCNTSTIGFAVESVNCNIQRRIKKNINLEKTESLIRYVQSKGYISIINIIFGFPYETKEEILYSISFIKDKLRPNWTQFLIATPLIGTDMYREFIEEGCFNDSPEIWMEGWFNYRNFDTPWITAKELNELYYRANLDCNFINNYDLKMGNYNRAELLFKSVIRLYPFQIFAWDGLRRVKEALGNEEEVKMIKSKIKELIQKEPRSKDLLEKYGDLFPKTIYNL